MKRIAITLALAAVMAAIPPQARTQTSTSTKEKTILIPVCGLIILIGVGYVVVKGAFHRCSLIESNRNWQITNAVGSDSLPPLWLNATPELLVRLQSFSGSVWQDEIEVRWSQIVNTIHGIAYKNGSPVATNHAELSTDGWATLDFSNLNRSTNRPSVGMFRLVQ